MDWYNVIADKEMILGVHYTPGRSQSIRGIVLHHNAGDLTVEGCYSVWQTREASAHYQVQSDGLVGQLVHDWDTAWHAGDANPWSIGIEHANNCFGPWTISDACLESGAHLVAALCRLYGLGRPEWMVNVFPHSHFMATACPGEIAGSQNAVYMLRAQQWYDAMCAGADAGAAPSGTSSAPSGNVADLAARVIAGEFGNGDARRAALGARYDEVQAEVNRILLGGSAPAQPATADIDALAQAVIRGDYGNGDERRAALGANYDAVQARVNEILGAGGSSGGADIDALAQAVIRGDYGNGDERRAALGANYDAVQARVNEILGAGGSSGGADIDALAQAVIRGDYGNGEARRAALGSLYDAVQARVNELLA